MARGKKTGGRDFKKGEGGRKKGAKDKVPRGIKRSIKYVYEELADKDPDLFRECVKRGLKSGTRAFPFLQLGAHYLDGRPALPIKIGPDLSAYTPEELDILEKLLEKGTPK